MEFFRQTNRIALFIAFAASLMPTVRAESWQPLFNGKDLTGWETWLGRPPASANVPEIKRDAQGNYLEPIGAGRDPLRVFRVENVDGEPALHFTGEGTGALITVGPYSNYRLRLQFKWGKQKFPPRRNEPRDSGIQFHITTPFGQHQGVWADCFEFQVEEHDCGDLWTTGVKAQLHARPKVGDQFAVYDPTKPLIEIGAWTDPNSARCIKSADFEKPNGEWNTLELICYGDRAMYQVNGHVVLRIEHLLHANGPKWAPSTVGKIALQLEAAEMYYRRIEIAPLSQMPRS